MTLIYEYFTNIVTKLDDITKRDGQDRLGKKGSVSCDNNSDLEYLESTAYLWQENDKQFRIVRFCTAIISIVKLLCYDLGSNGTKSGKELNYISNSRQS